MIARPIAFAFLLSCVCSLARVQGEGVALRTLKESTDPAHAVVRVFPKEKSDQPIPRFITGKFAEHLGWNIYHGMDAQILQNPTFADYPFWNGRMSPDGVTKFQVEDARIDDELRRQAQRFGCPDSELSSLTEARAEALACFWARLGNAKEIQLSPDTGPHGGRSQRVEVKAPGQGIAQWTWLPLHRQRDYEIELMIRSPGIKSVTVSLSAQPSMAGGVSNHLEGISGTWSRLRGKISVPKDWPDRVAYKFAITADSPGEFVIRHAFLRPVDHMNGADPDVVRLLKDSHLPLLRWPGGNFVSTYHWEDAIGPVERRLTLPNYAWGGIELNTFGTDEFIAFCRAVGCEPILCVNAGSGSAEEAARWIEYCNGSSTSPMGRVRASNGHAEPYGVKYWEVGNELWGKWQMNWTTATGYADRFKIISAAMLAADPSIRLYSCGAPAMWGRDWNRTLAASAGTAIGTITDHPLIGGEVLPTATPIEVYRDFMAVPEALQQKWTVLRDDMVRAGIGNPRLAVTELQLFAHLAGKKDSDAPVRLTYETLPGQGSITEAIYDVLIYHAAIRLTPFVELITHSATVNHGGGLRKEREHVWANPCHYAQAMFAAMADSRPVPVEISSATEPAPMVLPDLQKATNAISFCTVDALAAIAPDQAILLSIVHRGTAGPVEVEIQVPDFEAADLAEVTTLSAQNCWEGNTLERPELIKAIRSTAPIQNGALQLTLPLRSRPDTSSALRWLATMTLQPGSPRSFLTILDGSGSRSTEPS